ncbi:MAG: hypothetical protein Q4C05_02965 [Akkermansia sp.]|nr:hypothetical protein [Akkermansia sp.]
MFFYRFSIISVLTLLFFCKAEDKTGYVFELSNEPIKVKPAELDTASIFFPKYAKGTTTEAIAQPLLPVNEDTQSPDDVNESTIKIKLDSDEAKDNQPRHLGYEFFFSPSEKELVIYTEPNDPSIWINDGDVNSPFFRSTTSTPTNAPKSPKTEDTSEATKIVSELLPGFFPLLPKYSSEKK